MSSRVEHDEEISFQLLHAKEERASRARVPPARGAGTRARKIRTGRRGLVMVGSPTPPPGVIAIHMLRMCVFAQILPSGAQVRRPAAASHSLTFEELNSVCNFAEGTPLSVEYSSQLATFSGPGFGALNGGVSAHACALASGAYPPLGNHSFDGDGFLAFSTLHAFHGRTGKPVGPETVRFDIRMTNLRIALSGIDGHAAHIELWSGPSFSFNDHGEKLAAYTLSMTPELRTFDLVDANVRANVMRATPGLTRAHCCNMRHRAQCSGYLFRLRASYGDQLIRKDFRR